MSCVLDASVALSWIFERAAAAERNRSRALLDRLQDAAALVPAIWPVEVQNALVVGERRRLNTVAESSDFLQRLVGLPIEIDAVPAMERRDAVLGIARTHGLSAYDASYVELALRRGSPFATFDGRLAKAAQSIGLTVI